jgi:hypothetical protein
VDPETVPPLADDRLEVDETGRVTNVGPVVRALARERPRLLTPRPGGPPRGDGPSPAAVERAREQLLATGRYGGGSGPGGLPDRTRGPPGAFPTTMVSDP